VKTRKSKDRAISNSKQKGKKTLGKEKANGITTASDSSSQLSTSSCLHLHRSKKKAKEREANSQAREPLKTLDADRPDLSFRACELAL
jgi:hypothetical protein